MTIRIVRQVTPLSPMLRRHREVDDDHLSTTPIASEALLDGDRQVRRRWSGEGKELVRVKKKRTRGRRSGGSEEVIYMWLWRFAT
jgi:hypothetical protein